VLGVAADNDGPSTGDVAVVVAAGFMTVVVVAAGVFVVVVVVVVALDNRLRLILSTSSALADQYIY